MKRFIITEEEKNKIREQHKGGLKIKTEKFKVLSESKLGNVKPLINEKADKELIDRIIKMNSEFDNDPTYVEYEKKYAVKKLKDMLTTTMGIDANDVPDEMVDMMMSLAGEAAKQEITPETVFLHKDGVIETVSSIIEMCEEDQEFELCEKLKTFVGLLQQI